MHAYYVHLHDENQRFVTSTGKTDNAFVFLTLWSLDRHGRLWGIEISTILVKYLKFFFYLFMCKTKTKLKCTWEKPLMKTK